ncbi:HAD family acid phosphatase [Streptacidiphilus jiangxiensis]|uniref:HAD superfamily, subfamily IIIB (Acid phosphatase) n=1 Tax=Streptacidiphilus jiangxiensis TaxID=235985 RepID=A0A1H7PMS9_STRJI|nr:HAD family acid phosphatase [Streptacidiphilus jiangxiensis]SEL37120.1 HAD superfamily, subfamily IIIB (Acid phosphatase) [Streptacidiphilus jiangxiensis]
MRGIRRPVTVVAATAVLAALAAAAAPTASAAPVRAAASATTTTSAAPGYAQWLADATAATAPALAYLQQRVAAGTFTGTPAVVLDIDNTALAAYYNPGTYPTPATPPVLQLAQYASAHGVKVLFVTARPELIDWVTEFNLDSVGYRIDGLYSRDPLELLEPIQTFKTDTRRKLVADGYDIVANVGNNTTDLEGGYADATFKLPDYDGLLS